MFHVILLQEQRYCELVLRLIVSPKASIWPQDWEQISFRSETLSSGSNNEEGIDGLQKGKKTWQ